MDISSILQLISVVFVVGSLGAASLIHIYWSLGGVRFLDTALPTRPEDGSRLFTPSAKGTAVIASALGSTSIFTLCAYGLKQEQTFSTMIQLTFWGLSLAFIARAIGDFRYVGLSKRKRGTLFAYWDDRLFSPIILANGAAFVLLAINYSL